jgi:hypothetical protein
MYILKLERDDDLANIKIGSKEALKGWAASNCIRINSSGDFKTIDFKDDGNITYIFQNRQSLTECKEIGIIVPVEFIND